MNDANHQFYKEYCKLYYANIILTGRVSHLAFKQLFFVVIKYFEREGRVEGQAQSVGSKREELNILLLFNLYLCCSLFYRCLDKQTQA